MNKKKLKKIKKINTSLQWAAFVIVGTSILGLTIIWLYYQT